MRRNRPAAMLLPRGDFRKVSAGVAASLEDGAYGGWVARVAMCDAANVHDDVLELVLGQATAPTMGTECGSGIAENLEGVVRRRHGKLLVLAAAYPLLWASGATGRLRSHPKGRSEAEDCAKRS